MVQVRIAEKPSFRIAGHKTWISGQDNEQFGAFWKESNENGWIDTLRNLSHGEPGRITNGCVFGVSCVDQDPNCRAFDFFIATEITDASIVDRLEQRIIPSCKWAIFSNKGELPKSLIDAEMYAFMEWLPQSGYIHANAPEMEVYPAHDSSLVEFWLPISARG